MIKADITTIGKPPTAAAGESVPVDVRIRNVGDEPGWLLAVVGYIAYGEWQYIESEWKEVGLEITRQFLVYFTMPNHDTSIKAWAYHWDVATGTAVLDDEWRVAIDLPLTPAPPTLPEALLSGYIIPAEAGAGTPVHVESYLVNVGGKAAWFRLNCSYTYGVTTDVVKSIAAWVEVGQTVNFVADFSMPSMNTTVVLQGEYFHETLLLWYASGNTVTATIAVVRDDWPVVDIPSWYRNFLDSDWINVKRGDWINVWPLIVPPFDFEPGRWILRIVDVFLFWINWLIQRLKGVFQNAQEAVRTAREAAEKADGWFATATTFVGTFIATWWAETFEEVLHAIGDAAGVLEVALGIRIERVEDFKERMEEQDLSWENIAAHTEETVLAIPVIGFTVQVARTITRLGIEILDDLPDFLVNPAGWILDRIDDWLNEEVE